MPRTQCFRYTGQCKRIVATINVRLLNKGSPPTCPPPLSLPGIRTIFSSRGTTCGGGRNPACPVNGAGTRLQSQRVSAHDVVENLRLQKSLQDLASTRGTRRRKTFSLAKPRTPSYGLRKAVGRDMVRAWATSAGSSARANSATAREKFQCQALQW